MKTVEELMNDSTKVTKCLVKRFEGCGADFTIGCIVFDAFNFLSKADADFLYNNLLKKWSK